MKHFSKGTQSDIQHFSNSSKGTVTTNKDGSVTKTQTNAQGTKTQELTTGNGPLGDKNVKYVTTSQQPGGKQFTNTYTSKTDLLGVTQSSHERQAIYKHDNRTLTKTHTETVDQWGVQKNTKTESKTMDYGPKSKTYTGSVTTDSKGNKSWSSDVTHVTKNGDTTFTTNTKKSGGTELTTTNDKKLEDDKLSMSSGAEWKNTKYNQQSSFNLEMGKGNPQDAGFSQTKQDKLGAAQSGGNLLGAAGAKTDLLKGEFNEMKEINLSPDENSFFGARQGYKGEYKVTVGADGVNAAFKAEAKQGLYVETTQSKSNEYGDLTYGASAKAEGIASIDYKGKLDTNGLDTKVDLKVGASIELSGNYKAQSKSVTVAGVEVNASSEGTAKVAAELKAEATGTVQVTRNPPAMIAEGTVGVSAVVKAEAEIKVSAGPFSMKASGYASAGAEAKATGVIGYQDGKIKIGGSVGAALGLGAGGSVGVEVDVKMVGDMVKNTAVSAADANGDGQLGLDDAKAAVGKAADTVKGWFGW